MPDSSVDSAKTRDRLIDLYYDLSPLEQLMVQLFSVIYEPISRASFALCLNQIGAQDKNGKLFTAQTLKPYIDRLLELGLLVQGGGLGPQCHPLLAEVATRDAVRVGRFETLAKAVQEKFPVSTRWKGGPRYFTSKRQLIREVRIGIYRQDFKFVTQQLEDYAKYNYSKEKISITEIFQEVANNPFDPDWFRHLPPEFFENGLASILNDSMLHLTSADGAFALLQTSVAKAEKQDSVLFPVLLIEQLMIRGRLSEAQRELERISNLYSNNFDALWGWLKFLRGENEAAIAHYTSGLQALKKGTGKKKIFFHGMTGLFFVLALLKQGSPDRLNEALGYASLSREAKHWLSPTYTVLERVIKLQQGDLSQKEIILNTAPLQQQQSLETLFRSLCLYWVDADAAKRHLPKVLEPFFKQAETAGYRWLAMEAAELLSRFKSRSSYNKQAIALQKSIGVGSLVNLIEPQEAWELSLNALANMRSEKSQTIAPKPETNQRLAWTITYYSNGCVLQPREQSINAKGEWSKGRPIALKRLKNNLEDFAYLTPQDRRICSYIKSYSYGWGKTDYTFGEKAIAALIGHPIVFWEDSPGTRVEVVKGEPELLVKKGKNDQLTIAILPRTEGE
ncbi:hypothetical protein [Kovacikia minuta]|uniref:hypothetical protein n=1 Tax=Kovacikia minuta TaxID=2931930 RepID=UPI0020C80C47